MRVNIQDEGSFLGLFILIGIVLLIGVVCYFIVKTAVNKSNITMEIYALRQDLNELEKRQADRFKILDAHLQEQNSLLRQQNEFMRHAEQTK